jgi:signal transduction histidine kinase/transcriptional regulator with XRE-family HTH domain
MHGGQPVDLERLGSTIRDRRLELALTQEQLAERLGWSQERISILERGKYGLPSLPLLAHLAEALELPLVSLMDAVGFRIDEIPAGDHAPDQGQPEGGMRVVFSFTLQRMLGIQALDLKDAMNQASDLMAAAMGADKVDLFLHEAETDTLVALGTSNTPLGRKQVRVGLNRAPIANGGRQVEVFLTGRDYYTGNADEDPEISRGIVHALGVRSLYAVPLRVDGTICGILVAESVHRNRFSEAEREFFEAASRWVGIVAHRAQLQEKVTRQAADETRRVVAEEMLETVAHDLGNQITPIKGQIDLLLRRLHREGNERDAEQIAGVSDSLGRLSRMVSDLLDASRLEGGIFSLNCHRADLVDIVHSVTEMGRRDRPEIAVRTPDELIVELDPGRVTQALQNLIGNAIQHTPAGVPIVVSAGLQNAEDGSRAVIEVHDEGPGIASELLPRLFARHAVAGNAAGLGLGLYLAHGIARAHGGDLTVQSEPGRGTTFTLTLPSSVRPDDDL